MKNNNKAIITIPDSAVKKAIEEHIANLTKTKIRQIVDQTIDAALDEILRKKIEARITAMTNSGYGYFSDSKLRDRFAEILNEHAKKFSTNERFEAFVNEKLADLERRFLANNYKATLKTDEATIRKIVKEVLTSALKG